MSAPKTPTGKKHEEADKTNKHAATMMVCGRAELDAEQGPVRAVAIVWLSLITAE